MMNSISDLAANRAVSRLPQLGIATIASPALLADAWSLRNKVTIYDAVYVALARNLGITLVTADARLVSAIKGTGVKARVVDDPRLRKKLDLMER